MSRRSMVAAVLVTAAAALTATTAPAGAAATATFASGQVIVYGDGANNTIVVSRGTAGAIRINGGAVPIAGGAPTVSNTTLILMFGQTGNDVLTLDEANGALPPAQLFGGVGNDTLTGGSGADLILGQAGDDTAFGKGGADLLFGGSEKDTLTGGDGDDEVHGETGDDRFQWDPGDGSDVVEGQDGDDRMTFRGDGASELFGVSATGGRVRFTRNVGFITMDLDGIEGIDTVAAGGADQVTVHDVTGTDLADVNIDLVGSRGGGGDGQADAITVNGTNGNDVITVTGAGGQASVKGLRAAVRVTGAEPGRDRLTVDGLSGEDTVDAAGLAADAIALILESV